MQLHVDNEMFSDTAFTECGRFVVCRSGACVFVWSAENVAKPQSIIDTGEKVLDVVASPDGKLVATASENDIAAERTRLVKLIDQAKKEGR